MDWNDLYPMQREGVRFLVEHRHGALFASVGTGKSVMSMSAFEVLRLSGVARRALVVAPLAVARFTWASEYRRWAHLMHLRISLVVGTPKQREEALAADADMYVCNFDVLPKVLASGRRWDTLIVDELSKLKDRSTKRWRLLARRLGDFDRRWGLTGTPAPNHLLDLWPQSFVLDRGEGERATPPYGLGRLYTRFRTTWFVQTDWQGYKWDPIPGAEEHITERLKPLVFRASAEEMLGQKPCHRVVHEVALPADAVRVYNQVLRDAIAEYADVQINAVNAAVIVGKLLQITSGAVYGECRAVVRLHNAKYEAVADLAAELQGDPLLLIYQYEHELEEYLRQFPAAVHLTANMSPDVIDAWNSNRIEIALAHSRSLGHGVNLQLGGAHNICFSTPTYANEQREQTIGRLHRQGQRNTVIVHDIVARRGAERSIDHTVLAVLDGKETLQQAVLRAFDEANR